MGRTRILITGAAGRIGRVLCHGLADRYDLHLQYRRTVLPATNGERVFVGDVNNPAMMDAAAAGTGAIVHLAGDPRVEASWESILEANIRGVHSVYEAARRQGVERVIFASTNHVTGFYEQDGIYTTPDMPERPDSFYGASKAFGEDLGRYYADQFGLSVICLRIGSFQSEEAVKQRSSDRILSTWLSYRDCVQLVWRSVEAETVKFGIFYGISGNTRGYWDIRGARDLLGYVPQDDAEHFVSSP